MIERSHDLSSSNSIEIAVHSYHLIPKGKMGSRSDSDSREGALLRISLPQGEVGYADCFPWPELGDLPLEAQLESLRAGNLTNLTEQSLKFARTDAKARFEGKSLFSDQEIPQSHFLVTDISLLTAAKVEEISELGFALVKLKVGSQPDQEAQQLAALYPILRGLSIRLRLDFNFALTLQGFETFLKTLGSTLAQIDLIEDPIAYDSFLWTRLQKAWGVRLALDRISADAFRDVEKGSLSVLILKPAVQDWQMIASQAKELDVSIVVTSYLDHPVGQLHSAWVASQLGLDRAIKLEPCGLLSHTAYELNEFSQCLKEVQGRLIAPDGAGIGLDQLLPGLPWRPLR